MLAGVVTGVVSRLGEEDASEVIHKSAKSDFEVMSSNLPDAGANLEILVMHIARIF